MAGGRVLGKSGQGLTRTLNMGGLGVYTENDGETKENLGRRVEDGGRRVEDGGWRTESHREV